MKKISNKTAWLSFGFVVSIFVSFTLGYFWCNQSTPIVDYRDYNKGYIDGLYKDIEILNKEYTKLLDKPSGVDITWIDFRNIQAHDTLEFKSAQEEFLFLKSQIRHYQLANMLIDRDINEFIDIDVDYTGEQLMEFVNNCCNYYIGW